MENILFALIKNNNSAFVSASMKKDDFEESIGNGDLNIIDLPEPLSNIKIAWQDEGYDNFTLQIREDGWEKRGNAFEPVFSEQKVTGNAYVVMCEDGKYKGLSQEAYRLLMDTEKVILDFDL